MSDELLTNVILSSKPCPKCVEAAEQEPMTFAEWAASEWGLPGSDGRYCGGFCHCVLAPRDVIDEFPEISKQVKLRGEEGSEIGSVVDIGPAEKGLKEVMEYWNANYGKLPPEIYDMNVFVVEGYLRKLIKARGGEL